MNNVFCIDEKCYLELAPYMCTMYILHQRITVQVQVGNFLWKVDSSDTTFVKCTLYNPAELRAE